jgi:hypothetical protein
MQVLEAQSMPVDKRPALGSVCVVLGAGNQAFLAASDTLHHLFVEGSVCLLKLHPLQVHISFDGMLHFFNLTLGNALILCEALV